MKYLVLLFLLVTGSEIFSYTHFDSEFYPRYAKTVEQIQAEIDREGDGFVVELEPGRIYELHRAIDIRNYKYGTIDGNGATLKRAPSSMTATRLSSVHSGGVRLNVTHVPSGYRVGDSLCISNGQSVRQVTGYRYKITSMTSSAIFMEASFTPMPVGSSVIKSFSLIEGADSYIAGQSNVGTTLADIIFDGNSSENNINYGWMHNSLVNFAGGKSSIIKNCTFQNASNESLVGHGWIIIDCKFENLNGSAIHFSVHDNTKDLNAWAVIHGNQIKNINRIAKDLNGHSEGAITFSWGGGNALVKCNDFISESGNYGILGPFRTSAQNNSENLTFIDNRAFKFETVITVFENGNIPVKGIILKNNKLVNCGTTDLSWLKLNKTVIVSGNILTNTQLSF